MATHGSVWNRAAVRRLGRRRTLTFLAAATATLAAACRGDDRTGTAVEATVAGTAAPQPTAPPPDRPAAGGTISQPIIADALSIDLHQPTNHAGIWPVAPCFNQLLQFDATKPMAGPAEILPDLAAKWEQPDPATIVFSIRPGVRFHDGSRLTAEDPLVQLEWILNPPAGKTSPRRGSLAAIDAIESRNPSTLVIRLKRPAPSLLATLASHYCAIGQAADIRANGEVSAQLIGTGPFRLKRHLPSTLVELERNPAYHIPGRPYLDGLRFSIVPDRSNAFSGFIGGSYQIYSSHSMKQSDQDTLRDGTGDTVEVTLAPTTLRYAVFMNGRRRPFDDLRVRQAISLALDRDAAIKVVRDGAGRRGGYMMPKGVWALPEGDLRRYEGYDRPAIDKARQLLQQSGAPPAFEAITVTRTDQRDFGEFVRDQLGKAGIIVRLSPIDTTTAQPILQRGDFDLALWPIGFGLDDPDATFGDLATRKAARNWSAVYDPQIDLLFEKQSQTVNLDERKKLVQELEKQALSQYQHAALFFEDLFVARYKIVRDFVVQESQYSNRRMENVWLKQ